MFMFYVSIDVSTTFHGKVAVGEFVETLSLVLFSFSREVRFVTLVYSWTIGFVN